MGILGLTRRVLPKPARQWLNDRRVVRWARQRSRNALVLAPAMRRQLRWAGVAPAIRPTGARILVPLLETSHYQYYQILALAKALELRGAEVRVLVCDSAMDGCELKNSRRRDKDQCLSCRLNQRDLVGLFGLDVVKLSSLLTDEDRERARSLAARLAASYPARDEHKGVEIIGLTNDSVTRFYYGDVPPESAPEMELQRRRHLYTAIIGVEAAERLRLEWNPTSLVGSMGVYADWGPYVQYYRKRGVPYHMVSMAPYDMKAVMVDYEDFYSGTERFERWRAARATQFLTADESAALDTFLAQRFTVGGGFEQKWEWFSAEGAEVGAYARKSATTRNVFLFANLAWDIGINYEGALFDDVTTWVLETVDVLASRPDVHLYVKTHPEESYGSARTGRGIADAIRAAYPDLPANVTIIPPELKIRPYDLFPWIDVGVVYNGTVGLEMLLKGIPVITAGAAPYGGHGFSEEPGDKQSYAAALRRETTPSTPDPREVRLFAYFYFIKSQVPWRLTSQVYFDNFQGFTFETLDDLLPGRDKYLDHLCNALLDPAGTIIEAWD